MSRRNFILLGALGTGGLLLSGCQGGAGSGSGVSSGSGTSGNGSASSGGGSGSGGQVSGTRFFFDTFCKISGQMSQETLEGAFEQCAFFQATLSAQEANSDIDRINQSGGKPVQVEPTTAELISTALQYCQASDGLFDITIGAASLLWDFKQGVVPAASSLEEAVKHIDYTQVKVSGNSVQLLDANAKLDVGGVAKGFIADKLISYLQNEGVTSAFVNLGGNVKTLGLKPDGTPWMVGIQDPNLAAENLEDTSGAIARVAANAAGTSVVTSGLYERVFEQGGKRYWHILDPRTGWPVETQVVSASIVSEHSIDGDGYTKALFMWGDAEVKAFFGAHPELQGLIFYADGGSWASANSTMELR